MTRDNLFIIDLSDMTNKAKKHLMMTNERTAVFFITTNKRTIFLELHSPCTHELEWLEPWSKLAEVELKCSNRELVYVWNTNVTQST